MDDECDQYELEKSCKRPLNKLDNCRQTFFEDKKQHIPSQLIETAAAVAKELVKCAGNNFAVRGEAWLISPDAG